VLKSRQELAAVEGKAFEWIELYSCFPGVRKWAADARDRRDVQRRAVGLTFFGAPLKHLYDARERAMVRKLRTAPRLGCSKAKGGFVTKHHALGAVTSGAATALAKDISVQAEADRHRSAVLTRDRSERARVRSRVYRDLGRGGDVEHGW